MTTQTRRIGGGVLGEVLEERLKAEKLGSHRKEGSGLQEGGQGAELVEPSATGTSGLRGIQGPFNPDLNLAGASCKQQRKVPSSKVRWHYLVSFPFGGASGP